MNEFDEFDENTSRKAKRDILIHIGVFSAELIQQWGITL
jgi:hypothetical protein